MRHRFTKNRNNTCHDTEDHHDVVKRMYSGHPTLEAIKTVIKHGIKII